MKEILTSMSIFIVVLIGFLFAEILLIEDEIINIYVLIAIIILLGIVFTLFIIKEYKNCKQFKKILESEPDPQKRSDMEFNALVSGKYNPKYKNAIMIVIFGSIFVIINLVIQKSNNDFLLKCQKIEYTIIIAIMVINELIKNQKIRDIDKKNKV